MQTTNPSWPRPSALIISESKGFGALVHQMLRSVDWELPVRTQSIADAILAIRKGDACLIIVDDTPQNPAIQTVRHLLSDSYTAITPILCFLLDRNREEKPLLAQLGTVETVFKPLTKSTFIPAFRALLKRWETKPFVAVRAGLAHCIAKRDHQDVKIEVFTKLATLRPVQHVVVPPLSRAYCDRGELDSAESVLLNLVRGKPPFLNIILALGDFYMRVAMPSVARRLFQVFQKKFEKSRFILPDLIQADIFTGAYSDALDLLSMHRLRESSTAEALEIETLLLFAENREREAKQLSVFNAGIYKKVSTEWKER